MKIKVFRKFFAKNIQNPGGSRLTKVLTRDCLSLPRKDLALANPVAFCEGCWDFIVVNYIAELVDVGEDNEAQEDIASLLHHLLKQYGELAKIKGFGFVRGASKNLRTILDEIADGFNNCPSVHVSRDARLVGKLGFMEAKGVTKQVDSDPVKLLQEQGGDKDAPVVLWDIDGSEFIFNQGDQGWKQHELRNVSMN